MILDFCQLKVSNTDNIFTWY